MEDCAETRSDPVSGAFSSVSVFVTGLSLDAVKETVTRNTCKAREIYSAIVIM
jgi:hypothetical protein